VGREPRDERSRPPRDGSAESSRRAETGSCEPFESDFPLKNPKILESSDFFSGALCSVLPDLLRSPRPPRRLDPRRDGRREPLGVYSDDMVLVCSFLGGTAGREIPPGESGSPRGWARALRIPLKWRLQGRPQGTRMARWIQTN